MTFTKHDENLIFQADSEQRTLLWYASQLGMEKMVRILIESGSDVNIVSADKMTPFNGAVYNGNIKVIGTFMELIEIDLNTPQFDGFYPLTYAVIGNQIATAEFLIGRGANISIAKTNGEPLLMTAVEINNINFIDFLLKHKVDVNEKADQGQTALHRASFLGYFNIIKMLVEKGKADVTIKDNTDGTCLTRAVQFGHMKIVEYLLEKEDFLNKEDGSKLITFSIQLGHVNILNLLLQKLPREDRLKVDPLHQAIFQNNFEIVQFLVENYNVSVNSKEVKIGNLTIANPALVLAAVHGYVEICVYLVKKGANIEAKNSIGITALLAASINGNVNIIEFLIANGANVEVKSNEWMTPLHYTSANGHLNAVKVLIKHKVNINEQKNDNNYTPLHLSAEGKHFQVTEFLVEKGAVLRVNNAILKGNECDEKVWKGILVKGDAYKTQKHR